MSELREQPPHDPDRDLEYQERTGQIEAAYRRQSPAEVQLFEGEQPPKWFARRVRAAKRRPVLRSRPAVARPRERRDGRSAKATRAGPDDDPGEPHQESRAFAEAIKHDVATARIVLADVLPDGPERYAIEVSISEIYERAAAYLEALEVARAVGLA